MSVCLDPGERIPGCGNIQDFLGEIVKIVSCMHSCAETGVAVFGVKGHSPVHMKYYKFQT